MVLLAAIVYLVAAGWVSKSVGADDRSAIDRLGADGACRDRSGFARELACIRFVQAAVLAIVADQSCAARGETIEPADFLRRGHGCCFDRARFVEKALASYGFEVRRVALYERRYGLRGLLLMPGIDSHAGTEVLTSRGWLAVDSEQPFVLITRAGQPLRYGDFHAVDPGALVQRPTERHSFGFAHPFYVLYGVYSRHGGSHGPDLPAPEIHYPDFVRYSLLGAE